MVGCVSPVTEGELSILGPRPGIRRAGDPGPAGRVPAERHPRRGPLGRGEPLGLRPLLRAEPARGAHARRRAARVRAAHRAPARPGRAALRGHEAPAHHRPQPDERPRGAAARRADHRARPAGATRVVGQAVPAQARGRDPHRHHALHGRGRAALRPARRHGPRPDRRRGQPARADRPSTRPARCSSCASTSTSRSSTSTPSPGWGSGSRCCPTGCSSTPTTATRRSPRVHARGVQPLSSLVRRSTLEDVFLHLTGRSLVD